MWNWHCTVGLLTLFLYAIKSVQVLFYAGNSPTVIMLVFITGAFALLCGYPSRLDLKSRWTGFSPIISSKRNRFFNYQPDSNLRSENPVFMRACMGSSTKSGTFSAVRVRSKHRMASYCKDFSYDSRRSWFVCGSSFVVQFIIFGVHCSVGIFFVALGREFHRSESATGN